MLATNRGKLRWTTGLWLGMIAVMGAPSRTAEAVVPVPGLLVTAEGRVATSISLLDYFPNPHPRVQAVGAAQQERDSRRSDKNARLLNASELRPGRPGIELRGDSLGRNFGTYELVELIQQVGAQYDARHPGERFVVGDLSLRQGGTIRDHAGRRIHSSHRNGLDVDVMYLWDDCRARGQTKRRRCELDVEETLELMRLFVDGGPKAEPSMVEVMFVGTGFQDKVCRALRHRPELTLRYDQVLSRLQVMGGHRAHFHVRLSCPALSDGCPSPPPLRRALCRRP